jgi:hypothetical protein
MPPAAVACDGAAVGLLGFEPNLAKPVVRDHAMHHLQPGRHPLGLCRQQQAQRDRRRKHPPAHRQHLLPRLPQVDRQRAVRLAQPVRCGLSIGAAIRPG